MSRIYSIPVSGFVMVQADSEEDAREILNESLSKAPNIQPGFPAQRMLTADLEVFHSEDIYPLGHTGYTCKEFLINSGE